jgi:hypothetical protein
MPASLRSGRRPECVGLGGRFALDSVAGMTSESVAEFAGIRTPTPIPEKQCPAAVREDEKGIRCSGCRR